MRRGIKASNLVADQIVDRGLVLLERRNVLLEASPRPGRCSCFEAQKRQKRIAALIIFVEPFFQNGAEAVSNLGKRFRFVLCKLLEIAPDS